ncbi:MAG: hypothetical protein GC192_02025 [Bacteroidetes bacterium]|nr:hypothetical protein [Bacteroidota bacterium]
MDNIFDKKTVAIHQPNYFPWLGYFHKIYACDTFVFLDNVEHSKRYPTRRTRIRKAANDESFEWLTIPLKKHSDFELIKNLEVDKKQDWSSKHLNILVNRYNKTPYFKEIIEKLEELFLTVKSTSHLAEINIILIVTIMEWLDIERNLCCSSNLEILNSEKNKNIEIVRALNGTCYLSGIGGSNYQMPSDFSQYSIELRYIDFKLQQHKTYQPFIGNTILDILFRYGLEQTKILVQGK